MVALDAPSTFSGSPRKRLGLMLGGGSALLLYALVGVKNKAEKERGNSSMHKSAPGPDYTSTDALSVVHHPAKNANIKGSQPSASKWV